MSGRSRRGTSAGHATAHPAASLRCGAGGEEIIDLAKALAGDLDDGRPVALGFECPLFLPVPSEAEQLGRARPGEGSRPWSAGAGPAALAIGVVEAAWLLRVLATDCRSTPEVFLDWAAFANGGTGLFLWEAFVSADAKRETHLDDAAAAVERFITVLPDPSTANAVPEDRPVLSLIAGAAIWAHLDSDLDQLRRRCLVIRA